MIPTLKYGADWCTLGYLGALLLLRIICWQYGSAAYWYTIPFWGWLTFTVSTIKHNHIHLPVFNQLRLNRLYEHILNLFTGVSTTGMVIIHILNHHQTLNNDGDWGTTTHDRKQPEWLHLLQYCVTTPIAFLRKKNQYLRTLAKPKMVQREREEVRLIQIVYLLLFIIHPVNTLLFILMPNFIGQLLLTGFNYLQHHGCDEQSAYNHSYNFTGKIINWFTFNGGFHTIHHAQPNLHWSIVKSAHQKTVVPFIHPTLNQANLGLFLWYNYLFGRPSQFTAD